MNILIVDDQEENRYLLEALLKGNGYDVQSVTNGAEAIEHLEYNGIDLIISDILMPVLDGFELCRKVKSDEKWRHIPFIIYTATYTGPKDEEFAFKIGADRFIVKPCEPVLFMETVLDVMTVVKSDNKVPESPVQDEEIFKLYNERLVRKLEQKMLELEKETEALRQAQKSLRISENKYRRLHESMTDGFVFVDMQGVIIESNEAYRKMIGYTEEELSVMDFRRLTPAKWHGFEEGIIKNQILINHSSDVYEKEYRKKDGTIFPVELKTYLVLNDEDEKEGMWAIVRDITTRKQAEADIKEAHQRLLTILNNIDAIIYVIDIKSYDILFVNQYVRDNFGDVEGKKCWNAIQMEQKGPCALCSNNNPVDAGGKPKGTHRWEFQHKQTGKWYDCHSSAIKWIDGRIVRLEFAIDITDRKMLESQFLQAQKIESVGRLAGGVAHDYNNMLGVIVGYAELAMEKVAAGNSIHDHLEEILAAAKRSTEISRQLLAFARKQTINPIVCDLNEIVESMLKILRRLIGEDIDLVWLPESQLWPVKIDPAQIDQILANLCVNSRDAISGVGKVTMETGLVVFDKEYCAQHAGFFPGEFIMLAVSDNGCGMEPQIIDSIFEPFFTTKAAWQGTGLGLSTVYGIVKQNNGFINVYSEPGKGTTFKIYFPRHFGKIGELRVKTPGQIPSGHGEKILLVEDELPIMKMCKLMMENLGYVVLSANTPREAINLAENYSDVIHLLVTDVIMPEMNGRDLANRLQLLYPDIKTLFMSGYTANVIAHHGVLEQGMHFIQKPFSKKDIAVKIRKVLE